MQHHVNEIRELTNREDWHFCSGSYNPADLPSRGCNGKELTQNQTSWHGPEFLKKTKEAWPKDPQPTERVYVCLYTCASSRAVHLELVPSLSVPTFLQSFRRFVARRGLPMRLISDNAKTFKSSAGEVAKIARSSEVQTQLANKGVSWDFIVERAPWHGGFWERMVCCVKRCLKKSIGRMSLTFEELRTILVEVEATLNNRPLTYMYDNEEGVSYPLTPGAKYHQQLLHHFTKQWRNEYLKSLQERNADMRGAKQVPISVGDIVILKNDSSPRLFWKVAQVEELLPGRDNAIRSARICVLSESNKKTMLLRRPVQHLIPLEVPVTNNY